MQLVPIEDVQLVNKISDTPARWKVKLLPLVKVEHYCIWQELDSCGYKGIGQKYNAYIAILDGLVENFKKYCAAKNLSNVITTDAFCAEDLLFSIRRNLGYMASDLTYGEFINSINNADHNYTGAQVEVLLYNALLNFYIFRTIWVNVTAHTIKYLTKPFVLGNNISIKADAIDYGLTIEKRGHSTLPDMVTVVLGFVLVDNYNKEKIKQYNPDPKKPLLLLELSMGFDDILWHLDTDFKNILFNEKDDPSQASAFIFFGDGTLLSLEDKNLATLNLKSVLTEATNKFKL